MRKVKVQVDGETFSATLTLDEKWLSKPFVQTVVKPVVLKLNKRPDVENVSAEYLVRVEIDGKVRGRTPLWVPRPPTGGEAALKLERAGYRTELRSLDSSSPSPLRIELTPAP